MGSPSEPAPPTDPAADPAVDPAALVALLLRRAPTLGPPGGPRGRLLCLDGPAGSGKTTLAAAVAALTPARVVHLDDLYEGWDGLPRLHDQLAGLLEPLARGEAGSYRRYDWAAGALAEPVAVAPAPLLVLEGVGSGLAAYASLRTLLVWVEVPAEVRVARWRARDGAAAEPFIAAWQRAEKEHFARQGTRHAADLTWRG